jgi:uncharacterized alkaline shock family protein YloU
MSIETDFGTIDISPLAIGSLVSSVTLRTYGVVGMSDPTRASQITAVITRDPRRGVNVQIDPNNYVKINVYIVVNYGTNIASIANNLIKAIRYHVENRTGLSVQQVNVHVQDVSTAPTV